MNHRHLYYCDFSSHPVYPCTNVEYRVLETVICMRREDGDYITEHKHLIEEVRN